MRLERRLEEARGYFMLRMLDDALDVLDALAPAERSQPHVSELLTAVLMERKDWPRALEILIPQASTGDCPDGVFINAAICLHKTGRTTEARLTHLRCSGSARESAIFYYNLACYEAQLGEPDKALQSLKKSFTLDSNYRSVAREDPDLEPIRDCLKAV